MSKEIINEGKEALKRALLLMKLFQNKKVQIYYLTKTYLVQQVLLEIT
jgi:hypothetical protein